MKQALGRFPNRGAPRFDGDMAPDDTNRLLAWIQQYAAEYLRTVADRPVAPPVDPATLRDRLPDKLPDGPRPAQEVVAELVDAVDPGLVASAGPRYFGFVVGGSLPAAVAADWLTATWDQRAGVYSSSPAASVVEDRVAVWLLDLLGLPATASVGFATGATTANTVALGVARDAVLRRHGYDPRRAGLAGCPPVRVVVGAEYHASVVVALRYLGIGTDQVSTVEVDGQGAMRAEALAPVLQRHAGAPIVVCVQVGNVNTGAIDPVGAIVEVAAAHRAWVHVDGAFGLWAAASPRLRTLVEGTGTADSWAVDAHKWLNVPYDCAIAVVRDPAAHADLTAKNAPYLVIGQQVRDGAAYVMEMSRRARGLTVYAALQSLGRAGVADLVERCCDLAARFADRLAAADGVEILNDVTLNQVLVRFTPVGGGDPDAHTRAVAAAVQSDGTCWAGPTVWQGRTALRLSVSNWQTTAGDVDRSAAAILAAHVNTPPIGA
jgi:glutamate/tyrosine decarboxylase-like PLP-dependent enzyme